MADRPISLSKRRKTKARAQKRAQADANAVKFGRSKAEKTAERQRIAQLSAKLDGHKTDDANDQ